MFGPSPPLLDAASYSTTHPGMSRVFWELSEELSLADRDSGLYLSWISAVLCSIGEVDSFIHLANFFFFKSQLFDRNWLSSGDIKMNKA